LWNEEEIARLEGIDVTEPLSKKAGIERIEINNNFHSSATELYNPYEIVRLLDHSPRSGQKGGTDFRCSPQKFDFYLDGKGAGLLIFYNFRDI
jgi:hypothetical protein